MKKSKRFSELRRMLENAGIEVLEIGLSRKHICITYKGPTGEPRKSYAPCTPSDCRSDMNTIMKIRRTLA